MSAVEGTEVVRASDYTVSTGHYLHGTQMANRQRTQAMSGQRAAGCTMVAPLYRDINGWKGCCSKTNKILCLLADGLGARHKDQKLTDKKLSPGN